MVFINNRVLPLGSVVTIKGSPIRLMIVGYIAQSKENGKIYHYSSCVYPYGLDINRQILFNMEDIDVVFFMGYQNKESLHTTEVIKESIDKLDEGASFGEVTNEIVTKLFEKGDDKDGR